MKFLLLVPIFTSLLGCGPKGLFGDDSNDESAYTITSEGTPLIYELSANKCTYDFASRNPKVTPFYSGKYNNSLLSRLSSKSLDSRVTLGGEYQVNIGRVSTLEMLTAPKNFKYCIDKSVIDNESSYENAAINILYPLRNFEKRFGAILWKMKIPKINIQVLPVYTQVKTSKVKKQKIRNRSHIINNAMYFGAKDTLIFLPQGKSEGKAIPFDNVPLWKSPAVVMHEYAHHVFNHVVIKNNSSIVGHGDSGLCMDTREFTGINKREKDAGERRARTKEDTIEAINEGFADLFAYYGAGEKRFFEKMGCMERTRDIQSNLFLSYERKVLSTSVLNTFLDEKKVTSEYCELKINFQDPHMIGAILAHGFFKLLESTNLTSYYKLQAITDWTKGLRDIYDNSSNPEELLKKSIESFYKTVDKNTGRLWLNCSSYKSSFTFTHIDCR